MVVAVAAAAGVVVVVVVLLLLLLLVVVVVEVVVVLIEVLVVPIEVAVLVTAAAAAGVGVVAVAAGRVCTPTPLPTCQTAKATCCNIVAGGQIFVVAVAVGGGNIKLQPAVRGALTKDSEAKQPLPKHQVYRCSYPQDDYKDGNLKAYGTSLTQHHPKRRRDT